MENIKEKIQEYLDIVRWQGYISGKVEGAMDVLYEIDLDMEERIRLLQRVAGLSRITAEEFIEPREIKHRIFKNKELSYEEKQNLSALMSNEIMDSTQALDHPKETIRLIASVNTEKYIEECLPQIEICEDKGEEVSMRKIKEWIIKRYRLL